MDACWACRAEIARSASPNALSSRASREAMRSSIRLRRGAGSSSAAWAKIATRSVAAAPSVSFEDDFQHVRQITEATLAFGDRREAEGDQPAGYYMVDLGAPGTVWVVGEYAANNIFKTREDLLPEEQ